MAGATYDYTTKSGKRLWGFAVDLGMRYDETKRRPVRQQLRRQGFARRLDAERALRAEQHAIDIGTAPGLSERQLTVSEWADKWLASKAKIRPATRAGYTQIVNAYIRPGIGHLPLMQLRADHLDHLLALIRDGQLRPGRNKRGADGRLSASTIRQIHAVTTVMLGAAVKRRLLPYNPASAIELEEPEHRDKLAWSVPEADSFAAFTEEQEPRLAIAFRIALAFGLRRGELAALRWSDIDADTGLLHVEQNLPAVGELKFGPPKTRAGRRVLPLAIDAGITTALREHRKAQLADHLAAGAAWQETGLILAGPRGGLVPPWRLSTRWTELVAAADLPTITLHGARRTANSTWAAAGVDLAVRKAWGGWSDPSMADGVYLRLRPEVHEAAAQLVATYKAAHGPASAAL